MGRIHILESVAATITFSMPKQILVDPCELDVVNCDTRILQLVIGEELEFLTSSNNLIRYDNNGVYESMSSITIPQGYHRDFSQPVYANGYYFLIMESDEIEKGGY